ncbi:hypothetical protein CKO28_17170 [Rhodovibrio sodomensis]|uniref:Uncharacterized protein n=1 Tax=Rhodovibrio sodomensis TaxID=1088 RepID=A0ABS1DID2_9PROT|nr:hypothetical protein [Rhodovibrio sodomensis]MBK1669771.1 hypothetical protein [Rhodovibrio sodomensis]
MNTGWIVLIEGIAIFGLLIGFGIWQLRSLKKMEREDKANAEAEGRTGESAFTRSRAAEPQAPGGDSASDAGHPER